MSILLVTIRTILSMLGMFTICGMVLLSCGLGLTNGIALTLLIVSGVLSMFLAFVEV